MLQIEDRALSDLRYKITPHSDILQLRSYGAAFFGLEDQRAKINNNN